MSTTLYRIETQEEADRLTKDLGTPYKIGDDIRLYPMERGTIGGMRIIQSDGYVVTADSFSSFDGLTVLPHLSGEKY